VGDERRGRHRPGREALAGDGTLFSAVGQGPAHTEVVAAAALLLERFYIVALAGDERDRGRLAARVAGPVAPAARLRAGGDGALLQGAVVRAEEEFAAVVGDDPERV